jgi:hypothetical protein
MRIPQKIAAASVEAALVILPLSLWLNATLNKFPNHHQLLDACATAGTLISLALPAIAWSAYGIRNVTCAYTDLRSPIMMIFPLLGISLLAVILFTLVASWSQSYLNWSVEQLTRVGIGVFLLPLLAGFGIARFRATARRIDSQAGFNSVDC